MAVGGKNAWAEFHEKYSHNSLESEEMIPHGSS